MLAFDQMRQTSKATTLSYFLRNGMKVEYPATDQSLYLASILKSLFEYDKFIRRIITGLAGRDVRRAMEIFLEFCTSPHIDEGEILKIRRSMGDHQLPFHLVSRVLLRMNRRFYDGDQSYLKNLFQCHPDDARPSHFIRLTILQWLRIRFKQEGPTGAKGYHQTAGLISDLIDLGYEAERIRSELLYLVKAGCIFTEHQDNDNVADDDLIAISASGHVHLTLVENIDYLAAIAEDTWFDDETVVRRVSERIGKRGSHGHYQPRTTALNSIDMARYILNRSSDDLPNLSNFLYPPQDHIKESLSSIKNALSHARHEQGWGTAWDEAAIRYPKGAVVEGVISSIKDFGAFIELEKGLVGLISKADFETDSFRATPRIQRGSRIKVRILGIDENDYRIYMELA